MAQNQPVTPSLLRPNTSLFAMATRGSGDANQTTMTNLSRGHDACVDHEALQIPLAVLYSVIFVLGLVGNLVALWVFFCVHSKKNSVWVFLINVAFADLLLVVCLPFRILYHSQGNTWHLGPILCKVVGNLFYMNMYISITLLGLISVDRYLKIHHGTGAKSLLSSTRWSSALCLLIWTMAFTLTLVLVVSKSHSHSTKNRCFHYKLLQHQKWKAYINLGIVVGFWVVFVSLVVSYGKIARKLQRASQDKPGLPNAPRYARTAKKSFFILFLFTICFVPYHLVRLFYIRTQITDASCFWQGVADQANEVALLLSALNSCLDPVMYFLLSSSLRKEVLHLLGNVLCVRNMVGVVGNSSSADPDAVAVQRGRSAMLLAESRESKS